MSAQLRACSASRQQSDACERVQAKKPNQTHKVGPIYHDLTSGELHFHLLWVEKAPSETALG